MDTPIWARDLPLMLKEVYTKAQAQPPEDHQERLIDVVEWLGRIPTRHPRRVHISDVLAQQRILSPYEMDGIARLRKAMERGQSLGMFLGETTKSIRNRSKDKPGKASRNDLFFSDWGLLHFHLGADLESKGERVMRTRRVLITYVSQDDAYLLDVASHGKGFPDTWGNKSYLETLHRNWPHILERYELKGLMPSPVEASFSAQDYTNLRRAGVGASIQINGKVFMGPGLGISCDSSSTLAVQRAHYIMDELDRGERTFRAHHPIGDALLFVGKDASAGYFIPEDNKALCIFPSRNTESRVTGFFGRLLEESGIGSGIPDDAIWTASA